MRILHLVHQYPPEKIGGVETYTRTLAAHQAALGHEVTVVTPSQTPEATPPVIEEGVRVYRVGMGPRPAGRIFVEVITRSGRFMAPWRRILAATLPEIVHVQHLMGIPAAAVAALGHRGVPYVVTLNDYFYGCANAQLYTNYDHTNCLGPDPLLHNCGRCALARAGLPAPPGLGLLPAPLLAYRRARLAPILASARHVIAVSEFVREMYDHMGFPLDKFVVLPTGFDVPHEKIAAARREKADGVGTLKVVYIGGIAPQKGLHILIEAFNGLPADAILDIYGDLTVFPDYVNHLRSLITHPNITLAGRLPHDRVWITLVQADLAAVPTLWYEAAPLIIDEVFATGTPLIASALGAMSEKIDHDINGWLAPPGDVPAWGSALRQIYDRPERLAAWSTAVRTPLSMAAHQERLMALYVKDA